MEIQHLYDIYLSHPVICNDTRRITAGCIYWGIKGERFDGNSFARQALDSGAAYAVIDNPEYKVDKRCLLVDDSISALQRLANHHRKQLSIPLIAIAGSNGKTTTKELMQRVLSMKYKTFATPGNLNNHIGLPLSLLMLTKEHEVAIIELGANHLGENEMLCRICEPTHGLVTNIGKDHLEGFGGIDGVEKANMELFDRLREVDGIAFVNIDDERIRRNMEGLKGLCYSAKSMADFSGYITSRFPTISVVIVCGSDNQKIEVHSKLFGSFHVYNILAAASAGLQFYVTLEQIKEAVESYTPANMRSQIITSQTNTIILDAYNANPSSMHGSVQDFSDYPVENKVLVLGDMFELGEESYEEHKALLQAIPFEKLKEAAFAGEEFYRFKDRFPGHFFKDTASLKEWYESKQFENSHIYIKGSRGMKLEQLVDIVH